MPIYLSRDEYGYYFQWGNRGHRYHFNADTLESKPASPHIFTHKSSYNEVPDELLEDERGWYYLSPIALSYPSTFLNIEQLYSQEDAYDKARRQAAAAHASGYNG